MCYFGSMTAPLLDRLQEKVLQAASELTAVKKERDRLLAEVQLMQEESRRARKLLRQHGELLEERKKTQAKLERLLEKLNGLKV